MGTRNKTFLNNRQEMDAVWEKVDVTSQEIAKVIGEMKGMLTPKVEAPKFTPYDDTTILGKLKSLGAEVFARIPALEIFSNDTKVRLSEIERTQASLSHQLSVLQDKVDGLVIDLPKWVDATTEKTVEVEKVEAPKNKGGRPKKEEVKE